MAAPRRYCPWLGLGLFVVAACFAWPFTVDDAFIVARYADHLASGHGYAMNPGVVSDGVTGPLWLLPGVVGARLGVSPVTAAKVVDSVCACAAMVLCARHARSGWATVALATNAAFVPWAVAGLGSGAASLLLLWASLGPPARKGRQGRVDWSFTRGLAAGALAWLRPELVVAASVGLFSDREARRGPVVLAWLLPIVGVLLFRVLLFHHLWPLALSAKPGVPSLGFAYAARGLLVAFGGVAPVVLLASARRLDARAKRLAAMLLAHLVVVAAVGGDWMPGYRLLAPVVPVLALALAGPLRALPTRRRWVALTGALIVPLLFFALEVPELRASGARRESRGARIAERLADVGGPVALVDVGYLAYASGVEVVDLGGVTDAIVAGSPGGHLSKRIDIAYLERRSPRAVLLHSRDVIAVDADGNLSELAGYAVERRLAGSRWLHANFEVARVFEYAQDYRYVLLTRRASSRP